MIEFRKHEGMKGIVHGRRDFGRNDAVAFGVNEQDARSGKEFTKVFGDAYLL
jgi:hypothetical protein